jgi:hypothetical protein
MVTIAHHEEVGVSPDGPASAPPSGAAAHAPPAGASRPYWFNTSVPGGVSVLAKCEAKAAVAVVDVISKGGLGGVVVG